MTTYGQMRESLCDTFHECDQLLAAGQQEYAHDEQNAFRNFEHTAQQLGLAREQVLLVYAIKHLDGILAHVNGHRSQREDVSGRVHDLIVYLTILKEMLKAG